MDAEEVLVDSTPEVQIFSWAASNGSWIVVVAGELDLYTGQFLQEHLDVLLRKGASRLAFDLSGVGYMDSAGLKFLLEAGRKVEGARGRLVLAGTSPRVLKVLRLTGTLEVLPTCATVDEALAVLSEG